MRMTDDEPPRRRSAPQRLWTDPREEDEHTQWLAPKTAISAERPPLREPEPPPPPPDPVSYTHLTLPTTPYV